MENNYKEIRRTPIFNVDRGNVEEVVTVNQQNGKQYTGYVLNVFIDGETFTTFVKYGTPLYWAMKYKRKE